MAQDLKLDDVASRITDAILKETHISRVGLNQLIRPLLKVWLKNQDSFKSQKASKSKLQTTIEIRGIKERFWHNKFKSENTESMQTHYDELNRILIDGGYQ